MTPPQLKLPLISYQHTYFYNILYHPAPHPSPDSHFGCIHFFNMFALRPDPPDP